MILKDFILYKYLGALVLYTKTYFKCCLYVNRVIESLKIFISVNKNEAINERKTELGINQTDQLSTFDCRLYLN